jgi:hypothetical protein
MFKVLQESRCYQNSADTQSPDVHMFHILCIEIMWLHKDSPHSHNLKDLSPFHGPGSSVVIATGYGLDGPIIESRWEASLSRPALGPTHPPVQWVSGLSRG